MQTLVHSRSFVAGLFFAAIPAWSGSTLTAAQQKVLAFWLANHANYRIATDSDCKCPNDIRDVSSGYGDSKFALPDYHAFAATGDFNGDKNEDFAVALVDEKAAPDRFTLVVFNGPFSNRASAPAFMKSGFDLQRDRLFYFGASRAKPYRLWVGPFNSDAGIKLTPVRGRYKIEPLIE